ncbi:MAG: serine/threonine protein kinase [Ktedonobacteraceae bacterium]
MADYTGQQLGNYHLVRLLGRGGFADVYLGEHIRLKTQAAIKVRNQQFEKDDAEQFLVEAQTIANLVHPHIVRIFDFDVHEGMPFLVMEYAPNGTLRQRYPRGSRVPLEAIISNVKQIADALQYAHDEKFMHRDIKPENLLLGRRDDILLSDFGLALVAQSTRQQSLQELGGTAYYMSPEQLRGKPRPASDQYALGIVVYEWLTGERPFTGSFSEVASQHIFEPPPPIHEKLPTIFPAVEEVVMTALAKDPHQRFASVRSFANALEQASKVMSPLPGMGLLTQPPVVVPQPVNPTQDNSQPPALPGHPASPVQAAQSVPISDYPDTAPPVQSNYAQQVATNTSANANAQPVYSQTMPSPEHVTSDPHFSAGPPQIPVTQQAGAASDHYSRPDSPSMTQAQPKKRRTGLIIGLVVLLLLLVGGGIGGYIYLNSSTPEKTLSAVCTSLTSNDPQGYFNQLSKRQQGQTTEAATAQQFQQLQTSQVGGVKTCNFSNVQQNGSQATAEVAITVGNASANPTSPTKFTLIDENGTWKVDRFG